MTGEAIQRICRVTIWTTLAAIVFCLFFQISKGPPFRDSNPFCADQRNAVALKR